MKKNIWLFLGIIGCILIVVGSYFWATAIMDSLYAYRSPLKDSPPAPGEPLGDILSSETRLPRRVVFVLIDSLRYDTALDAQVMPFLNTLRPQGAWAKMHSRPPSYSEPGYTVLFTGAWPDLSDGPTLNLEYPDIPTWTQDNLFSAAKRAGLRTAVSGFYWFEKLIPQQDVDFSFYTSGEDAAADRAVVDAALPWLREVSAEFMLIHLDQVDYAGHHEGGPRDPRWNAAAQRADDLLREIAATLDFSQDALLVVSDHGQIDRGGHGGNEAVVLTEPFLLVGAGVVPGVYPDVNMIDVAPTVALMLGANLPASAQGFPLLEMLSIAPEDQGAIQLAVAAQQSTLAEIYLEKIGYPQDLPVDAKNGQAAQEAMLTAMAARLRNERFPRVLLALILAAIPAYLLFVFRRRKVMWFLAGALVYMLLFHLRYAFLSGRTYSLSSVTSANDIIFYTLLTAAGAFFVVWLGVMLGLGAFSNGAASSAQTSLGLSYVTLYLIALPILASFALNGALVSWALPHFTSFFLAFLNLLQSLAMAALSLVLCGVAALIGWLRRVSLQPQPSA